MWDCWPGRARSSQLERSELEHLLRAAGEIIDERQFIVIGSQSILGKYPNAPEELLRSREADFIAKNKPESTRMLEAIGEASRFYETHGYYADPVDSRTAVLPKDWKLGSRTAIVQQMTPKLCALGSAGSVGGILWLSSPRRPRIVGARRTAEQFDHGPFIGRSSPRRRNVTPDPDPGPGSSSSIRLFSRISAVSTGFRRTPE